MSNKFSDMRDILIDYSNADGNLPIFENLVKVRLGVSTDRKINALCRLFDNLLQTNAQLTSALSGEPVGKEDAFAALQMAITAQAANYQNGDNK